MDLDDMQVLALEDALSMETKGQSSSSVTLIFLKTLLRKLHLLMKCQVEHRSLEPPVWAKAAWNAGLKSAQEKGGADEEPPSKAPAGAEGH